MSGNRLGRVALVFVTVVLGAMVLALLAEPQTQASTTTLQKRLVKLERSAKTQARQIIVLRHRIAKLEDKSSPP